MEFFKKLMNLYTLNNLFQVFFIYKINNKLIYYMIQYKKHKNIRYPIK